MSAASPAPSPLQPFIDEELARAPMLIDQVLQSVADLPMRFDPTATSLQRHTAVGRQEGVNRARPQMVKAFCEALRGQVQQAARQQAAVRRGQTPSRASELSLVDDDEVEADVELQRTITVIQSAADYELRELNSFTSALLGEPNVTRETNPFRPEVYARALLAAVRSLPAGTSTQLGLMHAATPRLAEALKKAYASACGRLEDQGVEPAAFRTIILPPSAQRVPPGTRAAPPPADLHALRDSMPMPLDDVPPVAPSRRPVAGARPAPMAGGTRIDHQVIELLTRLFDVLLADAVLPSDLQRLLSRLQTSAVRVALRDPGMLDAYDHPVWDFMDRLAFSAERLQGEDDAEVRQRFVRYAQGLVDNLVGEPSPDGGLYTWASSRLKAHDEFLLVQRRGAAQVQIEALRRQAVRGAGPSHDDDPAGNAALDVGQLETVPAALIDLVPSAPIQSPAVVENVPLGAWVLMFLQGDWRELQLLWTDEQRHAYLFRQAGGATWALHGRAFERLAQAGLMEAMEPPSLVRHAAAQVLRKLPDAPGAR